MIIIKVWRHFLAKISLFFYKILYGKRLVVGRRTTWRKGFSIMISECGSVKIGGVYSLTTIVQ